ncbi:hypothetical protein [Metabacillus fastidiosus]|uniref:hypothetical protein n=1 Tax=Metabacillus fastidiosus TaxID=1458 RepID=UPI002E1A4169|nr:hypothetical protein [Metabacillus fastidiosus]
MNINIPEEIIYPSFDEIRDLVEDPEQLKFSLDTVLFGSNATLDSLALVSLIVAIEERIEEKTGFLVTLADDKAMSRKSSPFRNVSSLSEYIEEIIKDEINE